MILFKKTSALLTLLFLLLGNISFAAAENLKDAFSIDVNNGDKPLSTIAGKAGYELDPSKNNVDAVISQIITVVLSFLGVIFLALIIYAGYLWMTAQGDQAQVTKAKDIMERAVIGLVVVVSAYALSSFVIEKFTANQLNTSTVGDTSAQ